MFRSIVQFPSKNKNCVVILVRACFQVLTSKMSSKNIKSEFQVNNKTPTGLATTRITRSRVNSNANDKNVKVVDPPASNIEIKKKQTSKKQYTNTSASDGQTFSSPYFKRQESVEVNGSKSTNDPKSKAKRHHVKVAYEDSDPDAGTSAYFESDASTSNVGVVDVEKKSKWEAPNWLQVVENIREMRKERDAPVDGMGCDVWMDEDIPVEVRRYQSLVSLMLSSQTKDQVNHAAMVKLRGHGLTIENILQIDDKTLGELIYPVSFWKTKVVHIKRATQIVKDKFGGDIPDTVEGLCSLPGVGPKMAHICMNVAWGQNTGIGVDTHVHRISNRLGWVRKPTKTPEQTRKELESWLPVDLWQEVNHMLVGFGQQVCKPVGPKCETCLNNAICPLGRATLRQKKKK